MHITIQIHIHGCFECPEAKALGGVQICGMAPENAAQTHEQNKDKITSTCPLAPDQA